MMSLGPSPPPPLQEAPWRNPPPGSSETDTTAPPMLATFRIRPSWKNPSQRPSGEKNGWVAWREPTIGTGWTRSRSRLKSHSTPSESMPW